MLKAALITAIILLAGTATWAQVPSGFDDVPPWHWAFEGVRKAATAGIFVGYPTDDNELLVNALTQVYDAFVHVAHPAARDWAERFLTNLPPTWPQPFLQSRVLRFSLADVRVVRTGDEATIAVVASVVVRDDAGSTTVRASMRVAARKDRTARWRVDYTSLAASQPQVFK